MDLNMGRYLGINMVDPVLLPVDAETATATLTIPGVDTTSPLEDLIHCTVINVDVDLDSDNDKQFNPPDRNLAEDRYEYVGNDDHRPGKLIAVNSLGHVPDFL